MDHFQSDRFQIESLLGEGNFGCVYKALDKKTGQTVAIKFEKPSTLSQIDNEVTVMKSLTSEEGFPKLIDFSSDPNNRFIVMSFLGQSLYKKIMPIRKTLNSESILKMSLQCFARIRTLHNKNFIHRDLKPQQFLIDSDLIISLIDFGLSKKFLNSNSSLHIPYTDSRPFIGTLNYASINTHRGIQQSRRDDLESFCYIVSYLLKGKLPWVSKKKKYDEKEIKRIKYSVVPTGLFSSNYLVQFYLYVRSLQFEQTPNYLYLNNLILKVIDQENTAEVNRISYMNNLLNNKNTLNKKKKNRRFKRSKQCRSLDEICLASQDCLMTEVSEKMPEIKDRRILHPKSTAVTENQDQEKLGCLIF